MRIFVNHKRPCRQCHPGAERSEARQIMLTTIKKRFANEHKKNNQGQGNTAKNTGGRKWKRIFINQKVH